MGRLDCTVHTIPCFDHLSIPIWLSIMGNRGSFLIMRSRQSSRMSSFGTWNAYCNQREKNDEWLIRSKLLNGGRRSFSSGWTSSLRDEQPRDAAMANFGRQTEALPPATGNWRPTSDWCVHWAVASSAPFLSLASIHFLAMAFHHFSLMIVWRKRGYYLVINCYR